MSLFILCNIKIWLSKDGIHAILPNLDGGMPNLGKFSRYRVTVRSRKHLTNDYTRNGAWLFFDIFCYMTLLKFWWSKLCFSLTQSFLVEISTVHLVVCHPFIYSFTFLEFSWIPGANNKQMCISFTCLFQVKFVVLTLFWWINIKL